MKYVGLTTSSLLALACQTTPLRTAEIEGQAREWQRLPSVRTPEPAPIGPNQVSLVRPRSIGPVSSWRFNGDEVAASDEQGCGVWHRDGGYLGAVPAQTCANGDAPRSVAWDVDRMGLGYEDRRFELRLEGDRFELEGTSLAGRTKVGRYRTATFAPDDGFALAVTRKRGAPLVEIWAPDPDSGHVERMFELDLGPGFDPDEGAITGMWLGWSLDSVHALIELHGDEERAADRRIRAFAWPWPDVTKAPIVREFSSVEDLWEFPNDAVLVVGFQQRQVVVSLDSLTDLPLQPPQAPLVAEPTRWTELGGSAFAFTTTPPPVPNGCTWIAASWTSGQQLVTCDDEWLLAATPELGQAIVRESMTALARGTDRASARWGPRGLAIFSAGEGLRIFASDQLVATHEVDALVVATLDEELDLALVRTPAGPRVVDLAIAEIGGALAWPQRIEYAAFSPDRELVALAGEGELAVFERDHAEPLIRFSTDELAGLAFRQDGAVLYVGVERALPELALDPRSGVRVDEAQLDRAVLERLAAGSLDPSWRWVIEDDHTLVRTLDGQALIWPDPRSAPDTVLLESGWFSGSAGASKVRVRVGPEAPVPLHALPDVYALPDEFARPNLRSEFLTGQPLPPPQWCSAADAQRSSATKSR